ncbi:cell envelope integrity EipB family protein [Magnetospirillum aberrantis SpK]|uniref:Cell envelope integrity EipB family protein n=2 Tax=Magnetospirillum TaxID=13134 RepID=A0A7C9QVU2_9PROT|nr:cell envelope integrity EipB family protein [Magnetospirillum aberrantis SpK]
MLRSVWAATLVAGCVGAGAANAGPMDMAPHRAVYAMGLSSIKPGAGIAAATGTMSYEFDDSCDGWVVENRIAINYAYTEGGQVLSTTDFITWESKDGLHYKFRMRNTRDGQVTEDVEGSAELKGKGQGGVARFTRPEPLTVPLPKGTMFPTEHTFRLLDAAKSGGHSFWRVVFDGSGTEGPYEVNALIGVPSRNLGAVEVSPLLASESWPMRLAFYPVSSPDPLPNFEMALAYHPNGVTQSIVQSFRNFSLSGKLQSVEALPVKRCH